LATDKIPTSRMIRAARGLLGLDQTEFAEALGVARKTIIRIEADDAEPTNPRRLAMHKAIREKLEDEFNIRFVFASKASGEGVVMKRGS